MNVYAPRPLMLSTLLHAAVIALVVLWMLPPRQVPVSLPEEIFQVVPGAVAATPVTTTVRPVVFTPPVVVAPVMPAAVTQTEETEAAPVIATPSVRRPVTTTVAPSIHAQVRPATQASAAPRTTIEEFRKLHPQATVAPDANGRKTVKSPGQSRPARINLEAVLTPADGPVPTVTASSAKEADNYLARLQEKLKAAHRKPAGLDAGLRATVEFSIGASGVPAGVRMVESSGNPEFDESVLAAFGRVSGLGAPPEGFGRVHRVTFRTDGEE